MPTDQLVYKTIIGPTSLAVRGALVASFDKSLSVTEQQIALWEFESHRRTISVAYTFFRVAFGYDNQPSLW